MPYLILFQNFPQLSLGPIGTIVVLIITCILAVISWRQRTWKSTADAAVAEMTVYKSVAERLREEKKTVDDRLHKLEAMTDLAPLILAQQTAIEIIKQWIDEGRKRFDDARSSLDRNTDALTKVLEEIKAQRITSEDSYRSLSTAYMAHTLEDKEYQLRFVNMLTSVEKRLSELAVQIGKTKWEESEDTGHSMAMPKSTKNLLS